MDQQKLIADLAARLEALQQERGRIYTILCQIDGAIAEGSHWLQAARTAPEPDPPKE